MICGAVCSYSRCCPQRCQVRGGVTVRPGILTFFGAALRSVTTPEARILFMYTLLECAEVSAAGREGRRLYRILL